MVGVGSVYPSTKLTDATGSLYSLAARCGIIPAVYVFVHLSHL